MLSGPLGGYESTRAKRRGLRVSSQSSTQGKWKLKHPQPPQRQWEREKAIGAMSHGAIEPDQIAVRFIAAAPDRSIGNHHLLSGIRDGLIVN